MGEGEGGCKTWFPGGVQGLSKTPEFGKDSGPYLISFNSNGIWYVKLYRTLESLLCPWVMSGSRMLHAARGARSE